MSRLLAPVIAGTLTATTAIATPVLDAAAVNGARYEELSNAAGTGEPHATVLKLQILLDQARVSPGVIDGRMGDNTRLALRAFEERSGLAGDGEPDPEVWKALVRAGDPKALVTYEITTGDVDGPFADAIPEDYAEMAEMKNLSYTGAAELLAEKFHMSIDLLRALNPGARLEAAGEEIVVANVAGGPIEDKVSNIEIDKSRGVLRGYAPDGVLLVVYPATIGSDENPSPAGSMTVKSIAENPNYSYRPDKNFQQQGNDEPLILPPGPNGPVGSTWIDLSKKTFGIHGTAAPELVGKSASHGCVRLTNWDAAELAGLVEPGTSVTFVE